MQFESVLRGNAHRPLEAKEVAHNLEDGARLTLEREPHNQHDPNAIKVIEPESEQFIGYVAKEHAEEIAKHMDDGVDFVCTVNGFMKVGMPILLIDSVWALDDASETDDENWGDD